MLDPNHRSLLTSLLTPPPGMAFDSGVATTYTLDPVSLLGVPLHLAWLASGEDSAAMADPVRLLEALQRVGARLTVFCDRGRIQVPGSPNALFALLEQTIAEVRAPGGGAFHPKLWLLRFADPEHPGDALLRLGVLTRNLTADRSWDLSLVVEGSPGDVENASNLPLSKLLKALPRWAVHGLAGERLTATTYLADEVARTRWTLPAGWERLALHVIGMDRRSWAPGWGYETVVVSPFLTAIALEQLKKHAWKRTIALVSRADALAALPADTRAMFERCLVLDEAAETEDGEDPGDARALGLHAKAVILRRGWYTHLFVGSANATTAAMVDGRNVEIMAELVGKHSQVGKPERLLDEGGFGGLLTDFDTSATPEPGDPEQQAAEAALDSAHRALSHADLSLACRAHPEGGWRLSLTAAERVQLAPVVARAWPLSLPPERGIGIEPLTRGERVVLGVVDTADVAGLVGFELAHGRTLRRFALNLPVDGLPEAREAAILRRVVRDRASFLRYLRLLLGAFGASLGDDVAADAGTSAPAWSSGLGSGEALLEDLVRAWSREPDRLREVQRVVERLRGQQGEDGPVVPPDFEALWAVFERALEGT